MDGRQIGLKAFHNFLSDPIRSLHGSMKPYTTSQERAKISTFDIFFCCFSTQLWCLAKSSILQLRHLRAMVL